MERKGIGSDKGIYVIKEWMVRSAHQRKNQKGGDSDETSLENREEEI